ncbi:3-hydroxyisobutyrate dehydrogenase [Paraburkholderia caribensis]|uniref:3-hydroxyisobutyrate dehydrogenase n=1 Tax=Paraburkholderia caribensis TaxID=75105 RepID=A0A9Q6WPD5_9BURK|nr:3-hydroxyisobutyrate dehydrogenase [Paraburkholderia caribensis]MCO4878302.1 3-hydroxyisobutyrate dehydrogenase [Paraburkholderia caribensis]PTB28604.1 3-hydroxyisobutyrate dehydrogenase [Paraburkholderia caribensis]QLB66092.1 3-hydroxyisobutyrate dehydrogenase [Paraburkholderia caribensis]
MDIGFIGLGNMGGPMVRNLLGAGNQVHVFDMSDKAISQAVEYGAAATSSISELAKKVDVIVSMLPTPAIVKEVMVSPEGVIPNAREGTLIIDCSTSDPKTAVQLEALAVASGLNLIDAPVSGGVPGAKAGTLTFMVGGTEAGFLAAKPVLIAMGQNVVHCGPPGSGQAAKLCNNLLLGVSTIAVSESMCLGVRLGLDPSVLANIINSSSGRCWVSEVYNPYPGVLSGSPASNDFLGGFACDLMIKDLSLALDAAHGVHQPLPMTAASKQFFQIMSHQGNGAKDITAIVRMFQK